MTTAEDCPHTKQMDDKNQQLKFHVHKRKLTQRKRQLCYVLKPTASS